MLQEIYKEKTLHLALSPTGDSELLTKNKNKKQTASKESNLDPISSYGGGLNLCQVSSLISNVDWVLQMTYNSKTKGIT